jgi:hypothetical protein
LNSRQTRENASGRWDKVSRRCGKIRRFISKRASMPGLVLDIALPAERLLAVYRGTANRVTVRARDGRWVSLPAHHLRPFLEHQGVYGTFYLEFSPSGELIELRRLG